MHARRAGSARKAGRVRRDHRGSVPFAACKRVTERFGIKGLSPEPAEDLIGCFAHEYGKDGALNMDVYIASAGIGKDRENGLFCYDNVDYTAVMW